MELLTLRRLSIASDLVTADAAGTLEGYSSRPVAHLTGTYRADWDRLQPVLKVLAPQLAGALTFNGTTASDFRLAGPLTGADSEVVSPELEAETSVGWSGAEGFGLELGRADVPLALSRGVLTVPVTPVSAQGGTLRLGGAVTLAGDEPVYRLPGRTTVVEDLRVDAEVGRKLLSWVNPIFADLVRLEGTVSLATEDLAIPLAGVAKGGRGRGHFSLGTLQLTPGGLLAAVLALSGVQAGGSRSMEVSDLDFTVADGRIRYQDFRLTLGDDYDLRFRGSVAFDGTQELWVSLPVRTALLQKFGVEGPVQEYAEILAQEDVRLDVPIVGDRLHARLGEADVGSLVAKAAEAYLKKKAGEKLQELLDVGPGQEESPQQAPNVLWELLRRGIEERNREGR
jgi:hypothetical protein